MKFDKLVEAYMQVVNENFESVKAEADKDTRVFFLDQNVVQDANLVPAIAFALNAPKMIQDNKAVYKIQQYAELSKKDQYLTKAVNDCAYYLKEYFNGQLPNLDSTSIEDLAKSPYFGKGSYEGKQGLVTTVGLGAQGSSFFNSVIKVCMSLHDYPYYFKNTQAYLNKHIVQVQDPIKLNK